MNMRSGYSRSIAIAGMLFLALAASVPAQAGGYRGHYYGHGYGHGGYYYRGHHGHHGGDDGAYLVGGLILGSLITHAVMSRPAPYYEERAVVVQQAPVVVQAAPQSGRHLLRDRNGNCFEKNYNNRGDEVLVELDPAECSW